MQGPQYKFAIKNRDGQYYFIDDDNSVQIATEKKYLKHAPKGWQDITAGIFKNEKYKGNFTTVSNALDFVSDG
jgi:polyribonucleotide nucleotidyltransferase